MKKREALSVGQIINQAIERTGHADEFDRQSVCYLWPDIVGPTINRYTTRRWIDRDVLHVCISSASLKNDLQFLRDRLVVMLNKAAGKNVISSIVIH